MAGTLQRVLVIDAGEALAAAAQRLRGEMDLVETQQWNAAPDTLPRFVDPPTVVVIGPQVPNPAGVARRLREMHPLVHFVFVAPPGGEEALRHGLLYSAPANTPWKLVALQDDAIVDAVRAAIAMAGRARKVRTTLDRVNLQLAAPAHADSQVWRRLRVSDQFLASVLKHAQDAIISLDVQGTILSWNDGAARLFGRKAQEVVGENIDRAVAWRASVRELVAAAAREGTVRSEVRCDVAGRELTIDATVSAIEEQRAEVVAVAAILRDVTEHVRTQATLAASEARLRALADNIPQLVWITDETGAIEWYNQRWFDYTGTTLEQARGWDWVGVHHPEHVERVQEKFRRHVASGEAWEDTFPLRAANGEYRWFLSRAFPIRDASGRVLQWFGTNTDITEERAAQQALREADRRKNEFISMLSHELRNPLAPIRNSVSLLDRVAGDSPVGVKAREVIRRQTDHLTRLVDDLLDVTRVSRGKVVLSRTSTDIAKLARAAAEDHRSLIEDAGLELRLSLSTRPLRADVDGARLTQVLGNLLQNAIKFSLDRGWIAVALAEESGRAVLTVSDSGSGIDAKLLESLFQPFVQGARTLERGNGGLGLGLALAKGIVEMHGGQIEASSAGLDRGAQFTVRLPLAADAAGAAPGSATPEAGSRSIEARTVLIVDDNRDAADSLAQLVSLFGHHVEIVHGGVEALASIESRPPDVVLCDIGMPGMDGYEVARRIREAGVPMRLVAVTGYAQPEDLRQAAAAGFDEHVAKPPAPERIRRLLEFGSA